MHHGYHSQVVSAPWIMYNTTRAAKHSSVHIVHFGPRPLGPKEIDGLLVSPGKASSLLTDYLITGYPLRSELAQEKWFQSQTLHTYTLLTL